MKVSVLSIAIIGRIIIKSKYCFIFNGLIQKHLVTFYFESKNSGTMLIMTIEKRRKGKANRTEEPTLAEKCYLCAIEK